MKHVAVSAVTSPRYIIFIYSAYFLDYIYVCVCVYIYIYIYIYTRRDQDLLRIAAIVEDDYLPRLRPPHFVDILQAVQFERVRPGYTEILSLEPAALFAAVNIALLKAWAA